MVQQYLKAELGAAQVGLVFLPEGVGFDEQGRVDVGGKRLLQRPQHRLHAVPLTATHVHHHGETTSTHILTERQTGRERTETDRDMDNEKLIILLFRQTGRETQR